MSWMEVLAREGFDVFTLDMTGHGRSALGLQEDPRNLSPEDRAKLPRGVLGKPTATRPRPTLTRWRPPTAKPRTSTPTSSLSASAAALEWLSHGTLQGARTGAYRADALGAVALGEPTPNPD